MSATIRENMLVTMGMYAGELAQQHAIQLPSGNDGEDMLADFCVKCVDDYVEGFDLPFIEYAEDCLLRRFPHPQYAQTKDKRRYRVIAEAGTVEKDLGVEGTYEECERWCDEYDWKWVPDGPGGFEWDLAIEEIFDDDEDERDGWRPGDAPWNAPGMSVSDFIR